MSNQTEWTVPTRIRGIAGAQEIDGDVTIAPELPLIRAIDGGGAARDITLPIDPDNDGFVMWIHNEGATHNLVLLDDDTVPNTLATLTPGDTALVVWAPTGQPVAIGFEGL